MKKKHILFSILLMLSVLHQNGLAAPMSREKFPRFCERATAKMVQKAVDEGADVNARDSCFMTPLMYAASRNRDPEVLRILIKAGADVHAVTGEVTCEQGNEPGITAFHYAVVNSRNPVLLSVLLDAGANVNALTYLNKHSPLLNAASWTSPEVIRFLVKRGADVNLADRVGTTPLLTAVRDNKPEVVSLLLDLGAKVNHQDINGKPALMHISVTNHPDKILAILLARGADPNLKEKDYGKTALLRQCDYFSSKEVEIMIKAGADIHARDKSNGTALMWACNHREDKLAVGVVQMLLKYGSDVNALDDSRGNALMVAVRHGYSETVALLLKAGSKIDQQDKNGETALYIAVYQRNPKITKQLLDAGANKRLKTVKGETPYDLAKTLDAFRNSPVLKLLRP